MGEGGGDVEMIRIPSDSPQVLMTEVMGWIRQLVVLAAAKQTLRLAPVNSNSNNSRLYKVHSSVSTLSNCDTDKALKLTLSIYLLNFCLSVMRK